MLDLELLLEVDDCVPGSVATSEADCTHLVPDDSHALGNAD